MRYGLVLLLSALAIGCGSGTSGTLVEGGEVDAGLTDAESGATDVGGFIADALVPDAGTGSDEGGIADATDPGVNADTGVDSSDTTDPTDPDGPTPPVEETFRVLHWNIAGGKENDCDTAKITAAVVKYVKDKNVDLVGLNEVCQAQHRSIREALRSAWGKGAGANFSAYEGDGTGRVVGNGIYSRWNIEDVTRKIVGSDQYGERNLICAKIKPHDHLRFCSTHLTPGDAKARVQLGRVMDRVETWWTDRRDTVILAGDLNLLPDDPGLNGVYAPGASHPRNNPNNNGNYRELDDTESSCPGYGEGSHPGTTGGPCGTGRKIDFIFARQNRIVGDYNGDTLNIPSTCGGVCSDHRAVFGRVKVKIRQD